MRAARYSSSGEPHRSPAGSAALKRTRPRRMREVVCARAELGGGEGGGLDAWLSRMRTGARAAVGTKKEEKGVEQEGAGAQEEWFREAASGREEGRPKGWAKATRKRWRTPPQTMECYRAPCRLAGHRTGRCQRPFAPVTRELSEKGEELLRKRSRKGCVGDTHRHNNKET